ncbi:transposase [Aquimarina sp. RZ0]|uniref:transposase n=1 Tax=Aquimarina sp. RZ0 TaxID=2607730 RepID=UPI0011F0ED1F|nr:transposase [Aquimarina sp. RZ0]KAA1242112.1 transposase [Aquimarina sp. RZ0]
MKEVTDFYQQQGADFFIRANNSAVLIQTAGQQTDWKPCTINYQEYEITSFDYQLGQYTHRIIAYRQANKTGQASLLSNDSKKYLFIITNDKQISEKQAIELYNKRGDSERVFDIQNNDFNWNSMPHSFLHQNTVYLIIMAVAHIIYKWIVAFFADIVNGITKTSRLKKFIFRFVNTVAKFTRSGRREITHLATDNQKLIDFLNSE